MTFWPEIVAVGKFLKKKNRQPSERNRSTPGSDYVYRVNEFVEKKKRTTPAFDIGKVCIAIVSDVIL